MKILLSAGGTGGHLFPAVAVLEEIANITANRVPIEVFAVGNPEKIEARVCKEKHWHFTPIPMVGFAGFGLKFFKFFLNTLKSINICRDLIRNEGIDFGIATGAYISYPAGMSLYSEKKPLFLLESNLVPGRANRLLARRASIFFATFEETKKWLPLEVKERVKVLGTPIRKDLLAPKTPQEAREKFGLEPEKPTLLVFGGSLGARSINHAIHSNYKTLLNEGIQILWQTGKNFDFEKPNDKGLKMLEFIEDMASAYASADLVVARSGASTIAEISALGKPAILIPYPYSTNKHQEENARELANSNAAIMILDNEIADSLVQTIISLFKNPAKLQELSQNIRKFGNPNAGYEIAKEILNFMNI
jgi:UDP-N-acetylglucosamine--N-acetylmuramyl-(pentapeptide) pyrophosphoryl-undecaprenol N-acetylglucosamine transferase